MTDAEIGLNFKRDLARWIDIATSIAPYDEHIRNNMYVLMDQLRILNTLTDAEVGAVTKNMKRPKELEGLI